MRRYLFWFAFVTAYGCFYRLACVHSSEMLEPPKFWLTLLTASSGGGGLVGSRGVWRPSGPYWGREERRVRRGNKRITACKGWKVWKLTLALTRAAISFCKSCSESVHRYLRREKSVLEWAPNTRHAQTHLVWSSCPLMPLVCFNQKKFLKINRKFTSRAVVHIRPTLFQLMSTLTL